MAAPVGMASWVSSVSGYLIGLYRVGWPKVAGVERPGAVEQLEPQRLGTGVVEALVLHVGLEEDVAGREEPGDGSERGGHEQSVLDRLVEGLEEVDGARLALGLDPPDQVGAGHQPGPDRVGGHAPAVVGEVLPGYLEHPGVVVLASR